MPTPSPGNSRMERPGYRIAFTVCLAWALAIVHSLPAVSQDNTTPAAARYKALPPAGIELDAAVRKTLQDRVESIRDRLAAALEKSTVGADWASHVQVLIRSVDLALQQNLFFKPGQVDDAKKLLDEAERRIDSAVDGQRGLELLGWDPSAVGRPQPLVGGFVSRIDDSVQPFGIVVPAGWRADDAPAEHRMDVWLHGRGDNKTEIPFLTERMSKVGTYAPRDTFVLHPFGRHCNAFKFAGETDVYEAMAAASRLFRVDPRRVCIRGFSMGGAGCWHFAVHDPTRWMAANPGAGFVDTLVYQGWNDQPPFPLTPVARKLLNWYDVLPWTANLGETRTIAYSGEVDKQRQAADRVVEKASQLGLSFPYIIGADMGHKIDDASRQKIDAQIARWAEDLPPLPRKEIHFVTYTLHYDSADWVRVTGMREQWTAASVDAVLDDAAESVTLETDGVTHLEIDFSESGWPHRRGAVQITIDGVTSEFDDTGNVGGFQCSLARDSDGHWSQHQEDATRLRKRPGLQGPIDDAFCDRFVFVLPSRPARHGRVQRWIDRETRYAMDRWSRLMRGDAPVVLDRDLTDDQIETCHLICFGDFSSNRYLFNIAASLPVRWTRDTLTVGTQTFDPVKHAPVLCYPNPLNPDRYVVVNSGMTFRDFSNVSNSRQIAMLPDWAVMDVTEEDDSIFAGRIAAQGFFDEHWELPAQ
ncbi:prolyl oligopeptidase family serine peptidase [Roseiconus nitratireducens]|uniref:Prolyl oligopeptidase family serine peptidase n=1 Tax=Roseiconus nitratireducens TaxID=2605748 RepID=A0A5M6D0Y3_9BACT|nr:prolyl oligopeptidase family serine peptidase [Roseiconus nitratireducens]KAA5540706.1 prolyl oligopeptidase family serine peptidase [Roseiconus nitratireducens]